LHGDNHHGFGLLCFWSTFFSSKRSKKGYLGVLSLIELFLPSYYTLPQMGGVKSGFGEMLSLMGTPFLQTHLSHYRLFDPSDFHWIY